MAAKRAEKKLREHEPAARARTGESGAVIVEFALTLPLLILVVVGIFDFGLLFRKELLATNAAREGARMASLPGYVDADVQQRVVQYLTLNGITATAGNVVVDNVPFVPVAGGAFNVKRVTVTFTHTFAFFAPVATLFGGGSLGSIAVKGVSIMRREAAAAGL